MAIYSIWKDIRYSSAYKKFIFNYAQNETRNSQIFLESLHKTQTQKYTITFRPNLSRKTLKFVHLRIPTDKMPANST